MGIVLRPVFCGKSSMNFKIQYANLIFVKIIYCILGYIILLLILLILGFCNVCDFDP